ncbi:MAG: NADP-dependent oxidoreductase [Gammaproteobacteria bacterium]|nr:NADP-dependent oxidoreductase [Gammaproteobacteria bacterium]
MNKLNQQILVHRYPDGLPAKEHFAFVETPLSEPKEGEISVEVIYLSMDPFPRLRLNPKGAMPPLPLNSLMISRGVARVTASRDVNFQIGDYVAGEVGWQQYATVAGTSMRKVDPTLAPISTCLGVLGPSGIAAYFALLDLGQPKAGETVLIAAAAGSVGSVACQIAKLKGCRVVGIAGGAIETAYLRDELKIDAAVDWQQANFAEDLAQALNSGVDVFFDSVGGKTHDLAMAHLNVHARIALVGYISAYNPEGGEPVNYGKILPVIHKRARMQGFLATDYLDRGVEAMQALAQWVKNGQISYVEDIVVGIDKVPDAFASLFSGFKPGKKLVQLANDPTLNK